MLTQVCFVIDNIPYVTLFNASEFLSKVKASPEANYGKSGDIFMSGGYKAEFKKVSGIELRDVPTVQTTNLHFDGANVCFDGTVNYGGEELTVHVNGDGLKIDGIEEEEPKPAVEEKKEEPIVEVKKEDPKPASTAPTERQEERSRAGNVLIKKDITVEPGKSVIKPTHTVGLGMVFHSADPESKRENKFGKVRLRKGCFIGGVPADPYLPDKSELTKIGSVRMQSKTSTKYEVETSAVKEEAVATPTVDERRNQHRPKKVRVHRNNDGFNKEDMNITSVPHVESVPTNEEVDPFYGAEERRERKASTNDLFNAYEATQIKDETDTKAMESNMALKDIVMKEFAPEVVGVVDRIPKALFDNIKEFTGREVDIDALKSMGNSYCVNNNWHREGNEWYAIDVVPHNSRFFFNKNANVAVEIPFTQVRNWHKAITV